MTPDISLLIAKFIAVAGLALWMSLVALNNVIAFRGGVASLGGLMSMQLFDQEPAIPSPLLSRRVRTRAWHVAVYGFVIALEWLTAALLLFASGSLLGALFGASELADAVVSANIGTGALLALAFVMLLGGAWFAYYIRQEGTQLTHFALLAVALVGTIVVNL